MPAAKTKFDPAKRNRPLQWSADWIAPSLILLTMLTSYLRVHDYSLWTWEGVFCALALLSAGAVLSVIASLRPETLYPLILGLLILKFADVRFHLFAQAAVAAAQLWRAAMPTMLILAFAAFMFLIFALRREIGRISSAAFGVILITSVLLPARDIPAGEIRNRVAPLRADLPLVLHLVLDEQIGLAGLPPEVPGSDRLRERMISFFLENDFELHGRAFSQYSESQLALAGLLNGEAFSTVPGYISATESGYRISRNEWFEWLVRRGYSLRVYQSGWLNFCPDEVPSADFCYAYPTNSVRVLAGLPLSASTKARLILPRIFEGSLVFFSWNTPQLSTLETPSVLERLMNDMGRHPRGAAFFVHLLLPHYAYIFDSDCAIRTDIGTWSNVGDLSAPGASAFNSESERSAKYPLYFQQVACVIHTLGRLMRRMRHDGLLDDALVIIHGDHGSRLATRPFRFVDPHDLSERDLIDHYSTLMAIRQPGGRGRQVRDQKSIQQIFAETVLGRPLDGPPRTVFVRPASNTGREGALEGRQMIELGSIPATGSFQ